MIEKKDYSQLPESDCIINYISDRFKKGLYTMILVTGLPGTGKSSVCLRLAELASLKLHGENTITSDTVVDSLLGILKKLRTLRGPGEFIDVEEISVLFPSRRSMASENVAVGRILDTCRKRQVILFSNAPIFTSIDSHVRSMAHILIETQKILKGQEIVISKAWKLQTNPHTGKTYRHRFTRNGRDISLFITKKPNAEVWEQYEKKKDQFLDNLYDKLEKQTQKKEDKSNKELGITPKRTIVKALTPNEMKVYALKVSKKLKVPGIAKEMGLTENRIYAILKNIKRKTKLSE